MITFKQFILNETVIPEINWEHPIFYRGTPKVPIIAEYKDKNFQIHMHIDPNGYGEGQPQTVRQLLVKTPDWNKQLLWINGSLGSERNGFNKKEYFHEFWLDTPENRIKVERRYKEMIYALMKVADRRPKESAEYIKNIISKPL